MAKLQSNSRVYGTLTIDTSVLSNVGAGYSNMVVFTTGTSYTLPTVLQVPGAKFKATLIGAGGQGGGGTAGTIALYKGAGGGAGAVAIVISTVVSGVYTLSYSVGVAGSSGGASANGANGTATTITYNGITYSAGGGVGGTAGTYGLVGGVGGAVTNTGPATTLLSFTGGQGGAAANSAVQADGRGGHTPLGYGQGGMPQPFTSIGAPGIAGTGYGSGGSGGVSNTAGTSGGAGAAGLIIIEY